MSIPTPDNIWRLQANADIDGLIQALEAADATTRRRAAAALRAIGAVSALPALRMAISREMDEETRSLLITVTESLTEESGEDINESRVLTPVDLLAVELASDDLPTAVAAAQKLAELGDKTAVVPLILTFNDVSAPINLRLAVAEALLKLESAPVEVALLANLRHQDWEIRRNGAAILGKLKAEWAIEPLGKALGDPHPTVRKTALAALKYIGTPEARKVVARFATGLQRSQQATTTTTPASQPRSRLLDKPLPIPTAAAPQPSAAPDESSAPLETLPKDVPIIRVSDLKNRSTDNSQNHQSTSTLDETVFDDYERRTQSGDDRTP
ncbi:HEAT repeat domain-containing protein [Aggregatilineales bacterium SYSU G02658]